MYYSMFHSFQETTSIPNI